MKKYISVFLLIILGIASSNVMADVNSNLQLHLDSTISGTEFTDISINGFDFTAYNWISSTSIGWKFSAMFDGINDYLEYTGNIISWYPFSISVWVRPYGLVATQGIIIYGSPSQTSSIGIQISNGKASILWWNNRILIAWPVFSSWEWTHIVGTFASKFDRKLYVNWTLVWSQTNMWWNIWWTNTIWRIGKFITNNIRFSGYIDDARIYNRVLSTGDIETLYTIESPTGIWISPSIEYDSSNLLSQWEVNAYLTWLWVWYNITNNGWSPLYVFTNNGSFTYYFEDGDGNTGSITATVDWIDNTAPTATWIYSTIDVTSGNVMVAITGFSEVVTWLNATGYVFSDNGTFTFMFYDLAWNMGVWTATVNWIDKIAPIATVYYNIIWLTNQDVIASISGANEDIVWDINHVFTQNGSHTFTFSDLAGNQTNLVADVEWIDKTPITSIIIYTPMWTTNQPVAALVTGFNKTGITVIWSNPYTFMDNGIHTFYYYDVAGNTWSNSVTITGMTVSYGWWIDSGLKLHLDGSVLGTRFLDIWPSGYMFTWYNGISTWYVLWRDGIYFDGINDYIESKQNIITSYPFTISVWINPYWFMATQWVVILETPNQLTSLFWIQVSNGKASLLWWNNRVLTAWPTLSTWEWSNIVAVFKSKFDRKLYVNWVLVWSQTSMWWNIYLRSAVLRIGRFLRNNIRYKWYADDVRIYNYALSSWDTQSIYLLWN